MNNNIFIYFLFALLPGLIWLFYFLKKDVLPEPKRQIIKVFVLGALISVPVACFELWLLNDLNKIGLPEKTFLVIKFVFVIGLIEEVFKYLAARYSVLKSSHIDEPIDIPLYMIISALGFATIENILLFCTQNFLVFSDPLILAFTRFIGATLLHVLCSGIIGYFLALAFYNIRYRHIISLFGFSFAVMVHAFFNFFMESSIIKATENEWGSSVLYSLFIVFILFIFLSIALKRIKKLKGVCKI